MGRKTGPHTLNEEGTVKRGLRNTERKGRDSPRAGEKMSVETRKEGWNDSVVTRATLDKTAGENQTVKTSEQKEINDEIDEVS